MPTSIANSLRAFPLPLLLLFALALPAGSQAKTPRVRTITATVLQSSSKSHLLRVVTGDHAVRSYYATGLPAWMTPGTRVRFLARGKTAYRVHVTGRASKLKFYARVVRSGRKGATLRLGDGHALQLTAPTRHRGKTRPGARHKRPRAHMASDLTISVEGLKPGQTVLITLTLSPSGDSVAVTIKRVDAGVVAGQTSSQLSGTVTSSDPDSNSFTVTDAAGNDHSFIASDAALSGVSIAECDVVDVTYHSAADLLVADQVHVSGTETTGACDSSSSSSSSSELEALGTITALDAAGGSVTITTDDGQTLQLGVDPSLLDGLATGAQVDVLYSDNGDGTLTADDIQPA